MKRRRPGQSLHWDYNQVMKFVGLLQARPIIWDHDNPQFRNKFQRDLAYDELSFEMNTTNERIKKKIHTMRSQYLSECRKMEKVEGYTPLWQYFDTFKFLYKDDKLLRNRQLVKTVQVNNGDSDYEIESLETDLNTDIDTMDTCYDDYDGQEHNVRTTAASISPSLDIPEEFGNESKLNLRKQIAVSKTLLSTVDRKVSTSSMMLKIPKVQDEFTILAENIATELRLLKEHPIIQNNLKYKLLRAVKDAKQSLQIRKLNE